MQCLAVLENIGTRNSRNSRKKAVTSQATNYALVVITMECEEVEVVVVGAGSSGLYCAHKLISQNVNVIVLEARDVCFSTLSISFSFLFLFLSNTSNSELEDVHLVKNSEDTVG